MSLSVLWCMLCDMGKQIPVVSGVGQRQESVEGDAEICLEAASVNRIHVVCRTLIQSCIHLCSWVNLELGLHFVWPHLPFMDLQSQIFFAVMYKN